MSGMECRQQQKTDFLWMLKRVSKAAHSET